LRYLTVVLLAVAVVGAVARPGGIRPWVLPVGAAGVALATGAVSVTSARSSLDELWAPLVFLLAAVPLAVLLDELGFFESLAALVGRGPGLVLWLWVTGAAVTTVLSLDAAVVLLTPLYVRVARRCQLPVVAVAFQPVLLACLASSALPVSNLTNLIAASHTGVGPLDFIEYLALPSLVATIVGYRLYRRAMPVGPPARDARQGAGADRRALLAGGVLLAAMLLGFVGGPSVGVQPWEVALGADAVLVLLTRKLPARSIPWGTALIAASLAVIATAAARYLPVDRLVSSAGIPALLREIAISAGLANVLNNLPTLLVVLPAVHPGPSWQLWALLVGVNMGPALLVTGSLASLLWLASTASLGVKVTPADYLRAGLRIGVPALASGAATLVLLRALAGSA
jgi:arsenical pump membrane protein